MADICLLILGIAQGLGKVYREIEWTLSNTEEDDKQLFEIALPGACGRSQTSERIAEKLN